MKGMNNSINEYLTAGGQSPYASWLESLQDLKGRAIVITYVDRMELGQFGNYEPVGNGVYELRIHYGPGYRVYYAREARNIYLLLCGGDKSTQKRDITKAKSYWQDYKLRKTHDQS